VISNELIQYYESLAGHGGRASAGEDPHIRALVGEILDAWEKRVIVRDLRNRAGIATCSGEVYSLESGPRDNVVVVRIKT
jgi:hypothetical protein